MKILISLLAIILIITVVSCIACCKYAKMEPLNHLKEDEFYNRVLETLNRWIVCEIICTAVHIVLSILPFICSLMILHFECFDTSSRDTIIVLSIVSLSIMSISYFLKPYMLAQMFRKAYEILKPAVLEYESWASVKTGASIKAMQEALEAGEKLIGTTIN